MTDGEMLYLAMVVTAFTAFAITLAGITWYGRKGRDETPPGIR